MQNSNRQLDKRVHMLVLFSFTGVNDLIPKLIILQGTRNNQQTSINSLLGSMKEEESSTMQVERTNTDDQPMEKQLTLHRRAMLPPSSLTVW
jgi:hypothetical protein